MRNVYYNETILLQGQKRWKNIFELEKSRFENDQYFSTGTKRQPQIMFLEIPKGSFI